MDTAIPHCNQTPTPTQLEFVEHESLEVLFGGSHGSGKTTALLMSALKHTDKPGYNAIIFMRKYEDLILPGGPVDQLLEVLSDSNDFSVISNDLSIRFNSGAKISFGYLDNKEDITRYHSSEFQFIGVDMASRIRENDYRYLFSRIRKSRYVAAPIAMRITDNAGYGWVNERFIQSPADKRAFIPSQLEDNPHIDHATYREAARMQLEAKAKMMEGYWPTQ